MKPIATPLIICLLCACSNMEGALAQASSLDGKAFEVKLNIQNRPASFWRNDTFIFNAGQMHSVYLKKTEGFKPDPYHPTTENESIKFLYDAQNKYGSTLKIEGVAHADSITGTMVWTSDSGTRRYNFTGTLMTL